MKKIAVGISGASGAIYGIRSLDMLKKAGVETHLVISSGAALTIPLETDLDLAGVEAMADRVYDNRNVGAALASGSFGIDGMIIAPCSMRSLGAVANSLADNLIIRAADVTLKEGKPLILVVRETPLHRGHIRLMDLAARAGAVIFPPVPALYGKPGSIEEMIDHTVGRILQRLGVANTQAPRWTGMPED